MRARRRAFAALVAVFAAAAAVAATAVTATPQKKADAFKVAWIYPGPYDDGGWSTAHNLGRLYVQKKLGDKVKTTYKDKVFSNAQVPQIVAGLVRDGNQMIFATSFGELELGVNGQLWRKYPNVLFEQATGTQIEKNQSEYFGAAEDTIYLSGMAAGAATKNGKLGFVAPFPIPEVIREINSFELGPQATHPGATTQVVWTKTWFDPTKERQAAESLISAGVDVLPGGCTV
jgi:basic membrane lipoprotein Med (substrate-binding protein (PBP1-ABC) superfamily)